MFYSDDPITSRSEDLLNRKGFSNLLAKTMLNLKNTNTFIVGLYGKWGSGKTSIVNMALNEIKSMQEKNTEQKTVVVSFEPWNFSDTNQLLTQFFIRLSNEFRSKGEKSLTTIGKAIIKYSDAIHLAQNVPGVGEYLKLFGQRILSTLGKQLVTGLEDNDIFKQKEYIIKLLKKQNNQILIVIDDIDRLSNDQIRHMFRLVKSVADFPNTVYLLVFDEEIVIRALETVQGGSGKDYLEKIIQMPIHVPDIQKSVLRDVFLDRLESIRINHDVITISSEYWQKIYEPCIEPFVKNLRDIKRLCNVVQFKLTAIGSEIDFTDMVAITSIEVFLSPVYEWIKDNKEVLTEYQYIPSLITKEKMQQDWLDYYDEQFRSLLEDNESDILKYINTEDICIILSRLFPFFGKKVGKLYDTYDKNQLRKNNQISHPEKFDRYFHLSIEHIDYSKAEVMNTANIFDSEAIKQNLINLDIKRKSYGFLEEIRALIPDINPERARILTKALVEVSSQLDTISSESLISLNSCILAQSMILDLIDRIPSNERMEFILSLLKEANSSSLQTLGSVINQVELGYGRLAAKDISQSYKKIITLDELKKLEVEFCKKTKEILKSKCLFDFDDSRMVYYLLGCFVPDYLKSYMKEAFEKDENILRYLCNSITTWKGGYTSYEITDEYSKYLTKEQILYAIQSQKMKKAFFNLPKNVQYNSAAFFLHFDEKFTDEKRISQADIDSLLTLWENETNNN